ncbi:MAG TPA: hypothetical protein VEF53_00285, partial [Patescibacteria group bacterium]|nr:hypothetical protein [Patescibacteria group bacterium]
KPTKSEADTYLLNKKLHEGYLDGLLCKGYLDELLSVNTRMVKNSDYDTDSTFFDNHQSCFLTGAKSEGYGITKNVHLDHFIAIDTGHVGRIIGNIYPLYSKLNLSKSNKNPFEWIEEAEVKDEICIDKWNSLIKYFAYCYGLTLKEYENFVYWCYDNPRRIADIERDVNKTSLELWRKRKRRFGLFNIWLS